MILSKKRLCFSSCNFAFIYLFALIRFTSEELNLHKEFSGKHFKRFTNEKESFICKENNKFSVFLVLHIESAKNVQKKLFGAWLTYLVYELSQIYE